MILEAIYPKSIRKSKGVRLLVWGKAIVGGTTSVHQEFYDIIHLAQSEATQRLFIQSNPP